MAGVPVSDRKAGLIRPDRIRRIRPTDVVTGAWAKWKVDNPDLLYVVDCRSIDIPNTIASYVRNLPYGTIAVSLRPYGAQMIHAAERAARKRGVRILWIPAGRAVQTEGEDVLHDRANPAPAAVEGA